MSMAVPEERWERAIALLRSADDVALACHLDPDGDALGSLLAVQRLLEARGVRTVAGWASSEDDHPASDDLDLRVPPQYTFLPGLERLSPAAKFPAKPSLFIAFDTGSPDRLGSLRHVADAADAVIVLDHHARGAAFGDVQLVDGEAAATAVLVDELVRRLGTELDREMAACLYVGLVTDTGRFQHPSTTPAVMELGARLIGLGIDHARINRQVWETHSFGYLKVLGRAMERAVLLPDVGLAWSAVRQDDLTDLGITMAETEGLIDVLRAVEAADCVCVCKEQANPEGQGPSWKVSLRSKGAVDIGAVASQLGGGGHAFAAGFTGRGSLDDVIDSVADAVRERRAGG
jgi:bifunctional oligoribonuclease and PAP phosphatase NrnA